MAEQDRQTSSGGELPTENSQNAIVVMGEEEGVDGIFDEIEEVKEKTVSVKRRNMQELPSPKRDKVGSANGVKDPERCHTSSYHQYHHHQRQGSGGHGDTNGANISNPSNPSSSNEQLKQHKGPMKHTANRVMKENREIYRNSVKDLAEKGEAEDGEILEDGELSDGDEEVVGKCYDACRDFVEVSLCKSSNKDENKGGKLESKKSGRKRKHETKRKKKTYTGVQNSEDKNNPPPSWGSGYQGPNNGSSALSYKKQRYSRGSKSYQNPPDLYDNPSYSDGSDEESISKALKTEGYIDASVAADEKEGIFNHKVNLGKKSKRYNHKRGQNVKGRSDGPPKKKPLVDMTVFERPACKFYLEGKCTKGILCQFNHDVEKPKKMEVCKYHITVRGCVREKCQFMHDFPCKYYHTGAKCYSGSKCKFSHDPLTEETRRALEMRVAAESIIDMEHPECNHEYRPRERHNRTSLLGSPPQLRPDVSKIPSLFEIAVHPPGQSPKPSPQAVRPSGFYSETNVSPKSGIGLNSTGGPINSPNVGIISRAITSNPSSQHGLLNQVSSRGPGLLQMPIRPGNIMTCLMDKNRPTVMMGSQQAINHHQQRLAQFLGPGQINNNQQSQNGNFPPVLNMLGAIICEAVVQKGSGIHSNNINRMPNIGMGPNSILQNMNIMVPNMNNMGPNIMRQETINSSIAHKSLMPDNIGSMQANSTNSSGSMNIDLNKIGNMGLNNIVGNMDPKNAKGNIGPNNTVGNISTNSNLGNTGSAGALGCLKDCNKNFTTNEQNMELEDCKVDVDYRIQKNFEGLNEESRDLHELDKLRQQIQAQIDEEDDGEDASANRSEGIQDEQQSSEGPNVVHEKVADLSSNNAAMETKAEHIDIPPHLPKKQKELFRRIQQQQLMRENEWERQESLKAAEEAEIKAEVDDWYSSDEEGNGEKKPKLTDVLKKLNQESTTSASAVSSFTLGSFNTSSSGHTTPSSASTFNIMQMINAIKSQGAASADTSASKPTENVGTSFSQISNKKSLSKDSHQLLETVSSPISPTSVSTSFMKLSDTLRTCMPNLHLPALTVDPPVISAVPVKPLNYTVVKISINMPKPYVQLPDTVNATDPAFKDDPRVKWHLTYLEKQVSKEPQRSESSGVERPEKLPDPRLKKGHTDPRLTKTVNSPNSDRGDESKASDISLQSSRGQPADPRFVRMGNGILDPRLNPQNSQNNQDSSHLLNNMGGGTIIGIEGKMGNQIGGPLNLMGDPGRSLSNMGGLKNNMGDLVNSQVGDGTNSLTVGGPERLIKGRGGPLNNIGFLNNNLNIIGGPINNMDGRLGQMQPGQHLLNRMREPQESGNNLVHLRNSSMMSGPGNSMTKGSLGQQIPLRTDSAHLGPRMTTVLDPRLGSQKILNETHGNCDPRLKNKLIGLREQQLSMSDPGLIRMDPRSVAVNSSKDNRLNDQRTFDNSDNFRSFSSRIREQGGFHQNPNCVQSNAIFLGAAGQSKISEACEEWMPDTDSSIESNVNLPPVSSSSSVKSSSDEKSAPQFHHRNDPRFRRVKRLMGQQEFSMEHSLPLGWEEGHGNSDVGRTNEHTGPSQNGYNPPRPLGRDPRIKNLNSPQLSDRFPDLQLPNSHSLAVTESGPDLKVKDIFKAIDPTASPFC